MRWEGRQTAVMTGGQGGETIRNKGKNTILLHAHNPDSICWMEAHAGHCAAKHSCCKKRGELLFPELSKSLQGRGQACITGQVLDDNTHN